jgi:hypothetical protein
MKQSDLQPGDLFLVASSGLFSRMINAVQRFWSQDDHSQYTHAGIILNWDGDTFEAVGKGIRKGNLFAYAGKPVLIARHESMTEPLFQEAFEKTYKRCGDPYPVHRLFFHLFPPISKYWGLGMAVCSELVAEFLYFAGILGYWMGVNPDELEEMFRHWKGFEIVYEGICPKGW